VVFDRIAFAPELTVGFIDRLQQTIEAGRLVDWPQASELAAKAI
jgi:hypothetical protein